MRGEKPGEIQNNSVDQFLQGGCKLDRNAVEVKIEMVHWREVTGKTVGRQP